MSLKLNGKFYEASGDDLEVTILSLKPECFKTTGVLAVKKDDKTITKLINIRNLKRIFGGGGSNTQKIIAGFTISNIKFLLGEKNDMPLGKSISKNMHELKMDNKKIGKERGANGKLRSHKQMIAIAMSAANKGGGCPECKSMKTHSHKM